MPLKKRLGKHLSIHIDAPSSIIPLAAGTGRFCLFIGMPTQHTRAHACLQRICSLVHHCRYCTRLTTAFGKHTLCSDTMLTMHTHLLCVCGTQHTYVSVAHTVHTYESSLATTQTWGIEGVSVYNQYCFNVHSHVIPVNVVNIHTAPIVHRKTRQNRHRGTCRRGCLGEHISACVSRT